MMNKYIIVLVCLVFLVASSLAGPSIRRVVGNRSRLPSSAWTKLALASDASEKTFFVTLKQRNLDLLEAEYWERTNPDSSNYRNWLSIEKINSIVAPPKQQHDAVVSWLKDAGISKYKSYGDSIEVSAPVGVLKALFNTEFQVFENKKTGRKVISHWGTISVPTEIADTIDMVLGLDFFPLPRKSNPVPPGRQRRQIWDWDTYVVPQTLYGIYSIPDGTVTTNNATSQAVIEWEQQCFSPSDLQDFTKNMAVPHVNGPSSNHIIGPNDPNSPGEESTLDIEWIAATGIGAQNWFWLEDGTSWLYGFAVHFMNTQVVPLVNSMSYGWNEEDQCEEGIGAEECNSLGVDSKGYVARVNTEFQKIGLRGISLLAASGDSGANGRTDEDCSESHFNPAFPAASPYVTAVGATRLEGAVSDLKNPPPVCQDTVYWFCASGGTEQAVSYSASGFTSGGGFSNVALLQPWQKTVVQAYLQTSQGKQTPTSYFNASGRAFPDIAALGDKILIYMGGYDTSVGGTSCSAPIVAGIMSLLNDYTLTKTGKPLGPLNPLLYKMYGAHPAAFTDITVGDNACTESGCGLLSSCKGFYAAPGWDAVTGLGSPVYTEMLNYLKTMF